MIEKLRESDWAKDQEIKTINKNLKRLKEENDKWKQEFIQESQI